MESLPDSVSTALHNFSRDLKGIFADDLLSIILYGSGAEGKLRASSDVNVMVLCKELPLRNLIQLSPSVLLYESAVNLQVMFLKQSELGEAAKLFTVKFQDIARRHTVLFGIDPFENLSLSREWLAMRLCQVLLNFLLRLRSAVSKQSEEQSGLSHLIAESTSPLRSAAASYLELKGISFTDPKQALAIVCGQIAPGLFENTLTKISLCRDGVQIGDEAGLIIADLFEIAERLLQSVTELP